MSTGFNNGAVVVDNQSTSQTNLGLLSMATQSSGNVSVGGGIISGTNIYFIPATNSATTHTLTASDIFSSTTYTSASGCVITLPNDTNAPSITSGAQFLIIGNSGSLSNFVTFALDSGVTLNGYSPKFTNNGQTIILKQSSNTYTALHTYAKYVQTLPFTWGGFTSSNVTITTTQINSMIDISFPTTLLTSTQTSAPQTNTGVPIAPLTFWQGSNYVLLSGTTFTPSRVAVDTSGLIYFQSAIAGSFPSATSLQFYNETIRYSIV